MAIPSKDQAEVILIGCGAPLRGMGWYHAVQMLGGECPSAKLCHIVEPWFMGAGAEGPGGAEFGEFQSKTAEEHGVQFHKSMADLPAVADGVKRLALISGRTSDNPRLLGDAIAAGCTVIYLEKPGEYTSRYKKFVVCFCKLVVHLPYNTFVLMFPSVHTMCRLIL